MKKQESPAARLESPAFRRGEEVNTTAPDRQPSTPGDLREDIAYLVFRAVDIATTSRAAALEVADQILARVDTAPAADPHRLPDYIRLDLVRWHCTRCDTRSTWAWDECTDPLTEAAAEAWGHHANHEQWTAGPLSTAPPAGTEGPS